MMSDYVRLFPLQLVRAGLAVHIRPYTTEGIKNRLITSTIQLDEYVEHEKMKEKRRC